MSKVVKTACIGSGVIGAGWATSFALAGYQVFVRDINDDLLVNAKKLVRSNLELLAEKKLLDPSLVTKTLDRVTFTTDMAAAVADAQFIQESGPEKYDIKEKIIAEIEASCPGDAIIASSTSGLLITKMAANAIHPERIVGGHPYNPVYLMPLVEVTKGEKTTDDAASRAYDFYGSLDKVPVLLKKETVGFIANRLQLALYREAIDLVVRGVCSVEDVDKATLFGLGIRYATMGPNLIYHLGAGDKGIRGLLSSLHDSSADRLRDMANWTDEPAEWPEIAEAGVLEEIANRPASTGKSIPELQRFRDDMLIDIIKLHNRYKRGSHE
jgi:3-hydroxyacyl-CoA dehydrogenase